MNTKSHEYKNLKLKPMSKKQILTVATIVLFTIGSTTFIGCGNTHEQNETTEQEASENNEGAETTETHAEHAHYQCPMNCEDGKTYEEPGSCPKCNMDLAIVE